jgi:hypothetical protein
MMRVLKIIYLYMISRLKSMKIGLHGFVIRRKALVMGFSAPAPGKSQGTRERGSFLEKKLPHKEFESKFVSCNVCLGCVLHRIEA